MIAVTVGWLQSSYVIRQLVLCIAVLLRTPDKCSKEAHTSSLPWALGSEQKAVVMGKNRILGLQRECQIKEADVCWWGRQIEQGICTKNPQLHLHNEPGGNGNGTGMSGFLMNLVSEFWQVCLCQIVLSFWVLGWHWLSLKCEGRTEANIAQRHYNC